MPRIMTIDDSSTIRSIISKQMTELGFDIEYAEDGEQGLAKLEEVTADLILLDVTMPVMDGPTMLAKLRETGNKTPVIMLTSESKRSIVAGAVKLGIEDYILKPFKPEELRAKVLKALKMDGSAPRNSGDVGANPEVMSTAPAPAQASGARTQFSDILIVDDMENVHKKLRTMLPTHVSMNGCVSARDALQNCQEHVYRVVLIDLVIPDVNSVALMNQLRALQPHAVMVALALRTASDLPAELKSQGFQDSLSKPFDVNAVAEFLSKYFDSNNELTVDGNVLECGKFEGKEEKLDRYFTRVKTLARDSLEKLASACYDDTIFNMTAIPVRNDRLVRLVIDIEKEARKLGISVRLVGNAEVKKAMGSITETASMAFFDTVNDARNAVA